MIEAMPFGVPESGLKNKALERKSEFEKAGFKTGDKVTYKIGDNFVSELVLVPPGPDHPQGGALLMKESVSDKKKIPDDFLTDPSECEIHSYSSKERAFEAYPGILAGVKSQEDLFKVFKVLKRSGIDPNDPEIKLNSNPERPLTWDDIDTVFKYTIRNSIAGDYGPLKYITSKHGLREKVRKLTEDDKGAREKFVEEMLKGLKEYDVIYLGDRKFLKFVDGRFLESEGPDDSDISNARVLPIRSLEEFRKIILATDPNLIRIETVGQQEEKAKKAKELLLTALRNMGIGQVVKIDGTDYIREESDLFQTGGGRAGETVMIGFFTLSAMEGKISKTHPSSVEFKTQSIDLESRTKTKEESRLEALKVILPELYPNVHRHFGNLTGGHPIYNEVLKYLPTSEIKQGKIGDCYLLAAINSLKKGHPQVYLSILSKSLRKGPVADTWWVKFRGLDHEEKEGNEAFDTQGWIHLTKTDLEEWSKKGVKADLPDLILERAYASYVSRRNSGNEGDSKRVNAVGRLAIEGGFGHRALLDLIGSSASMKRKIGDMGDRSLKDNGNEHNVKHFLLGTFKRHPEKYVVTANIQYQDRSPTKWVNGHILYSQHAYSLLKVKDDKVYLNDPHDTSREIVLYMSDFVSNFGQISYVELK